MQCGVCLLKFPDDPPLHLISVYCNVLMYFIASRMISSCERFPACWRSGNIFLSFSRSSWLILDVSSSKSSSFTTMIPSVCACGGIDVYWGKDAWELNKFQTPLANNGLSVTPLLTATSERKEPHVLGQVPNRWGVDGMAPQINCICASSKPT